MNLAPAHFRTGQTEAMPSTGLFTLLEVHGNFATQQQGAARLTSLTACCETCEHRFSANAGEHLAVIAGGAVITCPECGVRQAVSNARFEEFVRRVERPAGSVGSLDTKT